MSGAVRHEPGESDRSGTTRVTVKTLTGSQDFDVGGDCTVGQLKRALSERLGASAEQLVLIHSGRVLREPEVLSHLKGHEESVSLCMIRRPQPSSAPPTIDAAESELTAVFGSNHDSVTPSPTSPLCLVEGLDFLASSGPGLLPVLQRQMERQLLADPEMMRSVLGSPLVRGTLSYSSLQLTRQLILSNPQIQQLLQTNPEVGDMLDNTDVISQVLELVRNPDMIEEMIQNKNRALDMSQSEQENSRTLTRDSDGQEHIRKPSKLYMGGTLVGGPTSGKPDREGGRTLPFSSRPTDPLSKLTAKPKADANPQHSVTAGMHSLLEEILASPGLMESLLSGPYVSSLLNCLSQNPDLAAQMLLSHPLFARNPQLQQEIRQQLPLILQQMQNPELFSALLNPKAMDAVLQIQQGLQTLVVEAPALIPMTGLTNVESSVNAELASDSVLNNQSGNGPHVATVTEQQQKFVHQMLQALANTNDGVHSDEAELHEELEQLSLMGFGDRQANLEALISTGGDLSTAIRLLSP